MNLLSYKSQFLCLFLSLSVSLSLLEWIIQDRKGLRKFTNFERLIQQGELQFNKSKNCIVV
jgi:hypothetical protein